MPYQYFERRCPSCGTVYKESDVYCSKCGTALPKYEPSEDELLNGIEKSKWCAYIGKSVPHYMSCFEKNKDKKIFANPNVAAMLFGLYWLFYRKMYKEGLIFAAANFLLSILLSILLLFSYQGELKQNFKVIDEYNAYVSTLDAETLNKINFDVNMILGEGAADAVLDNFIDLPEEYLEISNAAYDAQNNIRNISTAISAMGFFFSLLISIVFGLFADAIYKNHILKNIQYSDGGVSVPAIFAAAALTILINLISNPLSQWLTNLFIG